MPLASSSSTQLRIIPEVTFGVIPGAGNPSNLRITGETLDYTITKESSKEINATRTVSSMVPVDASASGGIQAEISYQEYDKLMAATLQSTWDVFGVNGVGAASVVSFAAGSLTASVATSGASLWTLLKPGQWFRVSAGADVNNGKILRVHPTTAPTSTVITLDPSTPATVSASVAGVTLATSRLTHGISQSSFTIERYSPDITQFFAYTGMTPSKMDVGVSSGGLSTLSFDFMGKAAQAAVATALPGAPVASFAYDIHSGVAGATCQLWEGGAPITGTFVKSISLSYDNALRAQGAICSLGAVGIGSGTLNITGSMSVYFADKNLFDKFKANTNSSLIFSSVDNAGNGYVFTMPVANISSWKSNSSGKDQDVMVDVQFTALRDAANAVPALQKAIFIDRVGVAVTP